MNPYYIQKDFTLYHGDSLKLLDNFPEESFDMIFADPPYLLSNGGISVKSGRQVSVNKGKWDLSHGLDEDFEFQFKWILKCRKLLKPNGTIWVSGTYHSIYTCGFALKKAGFHILNDIIYYKANAAPNLSGRFFTASHETLIWARKDKEAKHTFNYKITKEGYFPEDFLKSPGKQMRSVWSIGQLKQDEKKFGKHPTQKPFDLLRRIILSTTNEGDLILDPFTGSSTTGLAAISLNRRFIGIDKNKKYLDLSIKRLQDGFSDTI